MIIFSFSNSLFGLSKRIAKNLTVHRKHSEITYSQLRLFFVILKNKFEVIIRKISSSWLIFEVYIATFIHAL